MEDGDYYRRDLAMAHHRGFGVHAAACAPGILEFLRPVRVRHGLALELGCGSGLLNQELIGAGHNVVATDDAVVAVGHPPELPRRRRSLPIEL